MAELKQLDLGSILSNAETIKGQRQQNKLAELLTPLKVESATLTNQGANQSREVDEMRFFHSAMGNADLSNPEVANAAWNAAKQATAKAGGDVEGLSDQFDPNQYKVIQGVAAFGGDDSLVKKQFGAGLVVDIGGTQYFSNPVLDPSDGSTKTSLTPVNGGQTINADPGQIEQMVGAGSATIVNKSSGLTPEQSVSQKQEESAASERGKGGSQSRRAYMGEGMVAADGMDSVVKAMVLLDQVATGGIQSTAGIKIRRLFGVESADEGELSGLMGKAVLSQLRATFGAAFTEREGARLESIEAGFGKNTETNKRLLGNAFEVMERSATRGIRAAEAEGDDFAASEIRTQLDAAKATLKASSSGDSQQTQSKPQAQQQAITTPQQAQQAGWKVATDAAGNRAYVGPNGQVVEVQ